MADESCPESVGGSGRRAACRRRPSTRSRAAADVAELAAFFALGGSTLKWMGHFTGNEDADGPLLGGGESVSHAFADTDTAVCGMLLQGGARPGVAALLEREPINDTAGDTMELELEDSIKKILEERGGDEDEDDEDDDDDDEGDY